MSRLLVLCVLLPIGLSLAQAQADSADLVHTVSAGDTLISIAHAYGVTLDQLLTLNDLQPEALLQIGQRLVVIRAPEFAENADAIDGDDETDAAGEGGDSVVGGNVVAGDWPPAPVTEADAPMRDPADMSAQLCVAVFQDDNQNGLREPGEIMLRDATIILLDHDENEDDDDASRQQIRTTGAAEPICRAGLERKIYRIDGGAPPGYGWTGADSLRVDLRAGGRLDIELGAKAGLQAVALPPIDSALEVAAGDARARSLLRELSGLFALGLAGVVFFSGIAFSLFLRSR